MKDHESDNKIEKEEFIFFVDDMMAMEADQRKGYAAKGAFNQTLIDFINGFENRYRDYENKKMELYKPNFGTIMGYNKYCNTRHNFIYFDSISYCFYGC